MHNRLLKIGAFLMCWFGLASLASAQEKDTLGIGAVKPTKSLAQANATKGTSNQMQRVIDALDGQLIDRLQNTRKFTIINRSQLDELMKEISLAGSGNLNKKDPNVAKAMEGAGCKYLLVTSVDSFNDVRKELVLEGGRKAGGKRIIQVSAVGQIYDTTTGRLLESANIQVESRDTVLEQEMVRTAGDENDQVLIVTARELADKIANRVIEVLYPAKVVGRTDNVITINRGDGTGIAVGQTYEVYALGKEMIDPDTKESLGREEVKVGLAKIVSVQPRTSKAEVADDKGVDVGHVLRLVQPAAAPMK